MLWVSCAPIQFIEKMVMILQGKLLRDRVRILYSSWDSNSLCRYGRSILCIGSRKVVLE